MVKNITVAFALMLVGCGGGSRDPAADECDALFELICNRIVDCQFMAYTFDSCMDEFRAAMPDGMQCDDADQVSAGYPTCMNLLTSAACADLFPGGTQIALPPECAGSILYEP